MKRLAKINSIAGDGQMFEVTKQEKVNGEIILYLDNGFKYTLSESDYQWLITKSSNAKPKQGFSPEQPYIGDLKAVSLVEPIK